MYSIYYSVKKMAIPKPTEKQIQEALENCNVTFDFECDLCIAQDECEKEE